MISHPFHRLFQSHSTVEKSVQQLYSTLCRAVETATMRIGVKILAETSGAGVTGAAGEGRALASNRLQISTFLLSIT